MQIQPYLFLNGRCEEAIAFYKDALGAEVTMLMRFKEAPKSEDSPTSDPALAEKVMHADLRIGAAHIMMSDGMGSGEPRFEGFSLSITLPDDAAVERAFAALAEGGQVRQPLMPTFFASKFGMLADKFGVGWMVLTGGSGISADETASGVRLVAVPARRIAAVRSRVPPTGMREAQYAARAALAEAGISAARRLTLWRMEDGLFDYAPGVEVSDTFVPAGPVTLIDLPPGRAAHLAFRGGYEGLGEAWGRLFAGCRTLGVTPSGWNWEVYAADGEPEGADLFAAVT